ncbi:hypothetical protein LM595_01970, partial [Candidatus Acetothermia bacterium]|nr:hypothetical protein [Candidatus Acetothermia bacterium]
MSRWKKALLVMSVLIWCLKLPGGANEFADVAAIFQIGSGARPLGMGGAFIALADDENALFYNPAGLGFNRTIGITSLAAHQFGAASLTAIGVALPFFGVYFLQLDSGIITGPQFDPFRYLSRGAILSVGVPLLLIEEVSLTFGTRLRLFQAVEPTSGFGWTVDASILIAGEYLRLGAMVKSLVSTPILFHGGHREVWPTDLKVGIAGTIPVGRNLRLNLLFDLVGLISGDRRKIFGVEAWVGGLGIRAGKDGL